MTCRCEYAPVTLTEHLPLESTMTTFWVVSESSSLEKCPGPHPRSRTVLNFRLISCLSSLDDTLGMAEGTTHLHPLNESVRDLIPDIVYGPATRPLLPFRRPVLLHPFHIAVEHLERIGGGGVN